MGVLESMSEVLEPSGSGFKLVCVLAFDCRRSPGPPLASGEDDVDNLCMLAPKSSITVSPKLADAIAYAYLDRGGWQK